MGRLFYLLGIHQTSTKIRKFIIFNARKQEFQIIEGITSTEMRGILGYDGLISDFNHELREAARAHFRNAFSMLDMVGGEPGKSLFIGIIIINVHFI